MWISSFKLHPKKRVAQHHHHKNMLPSKRTKNMALLCLEEIDEFGRKKRHATRANRTIRWRPGAPSLSRNLKECFFMFIPPWGDDPIWLKCFQMGWNHQLVYQDINYWWILATGIPEGCAKTSQNHNFVCFCCWIWSFDVLSNLETLLVQ